MVSKIKNQFSFLKDINFFRLIFLSLFAFLLIIILLSVGISWQFTSALVFPECKKKIPNNDLPTPQVRWLPTKDGYEIQIWFYPPTNGSVIIVLGGLEGSLGINNLPVKQLLDEGFGLIFIDSRSCAIPTAPITLGGNELFDGEAALDFLIEEGTTHPTRIGVWGFSMGGATAIRLASQHDEIQAVVRDGGFSNLGELLAQSPKNRFSFPPIHLFNLWSFRLRTGINPWEISPVDDLSKMVSKPILFIFADKEADYGIEQFQKAKEPKYLWIVQDSQHGFNYFSAPTEYEEKIFSFYKKYLIGNSFR